jgi:hypothetical protein
VTHVKGDAYVAQVDTDTDTGAEMSIVVHSGYGVHESDFIL